MQCVSRALVLGTLVRVFLVCSFWSSGVMLIRVLGTFGIWNGGGMYVVFLIVSIPLVFISIVSVDKMTARFETRAGSIISDTATGVLLVHALAIGLFPGVYAFASDPHLRATAWLLWFGGLVIVMMDRRFFRAFL